MACKISSNQITDFVDIEKIDDVYRFRIITNKGIIPNGGVKFNDHQIDDESKKRLIEKYNQMTME